MKMFFEFGSLVAFFATFKLYGIKYATIVLLAFLITQTLVFKVKKIPLETVHWVGLILASVFAVLTIATNNALFYHA